MRTILITGLSVFGLIVLVSCWDKQDIPVTPPSDPSYMIFGTVIRESTGLPVREANLKFTMTELYQGDFMEPVETMTDSSGYYEIRDLYRGRYAVRVTRGYDWLFDGEVGIIEYADKEYNIVIPLASDTD